jgi:hypothetical protein
LASWITTSKPSIVGYAAVPEAIGRLLCSNVYRHQVNPWLFLFTARVFGGADEPVLLALLMRTKSLNFVGNPKYISQHPLATTE